MKCKGETFHDLIEINYLYQCPVCPTVDCPCFKNHISQNFFSSNLKKDLDWTPNFKPEMAPLAFLCYYY